MDALLHCVLGEDSAGGGLASLLETIPGGVGNIREDLPLRVLFGRVAGECPPCCSTWLVKWPHRASSGKLNVVSLGSEPDRSEAPSLIRADLLGDEPRTLLRLRVWLGSHRSFRRCRSGGHWHRR